MQKNGIGTFFIKGAMVILAALFFVFPGFARAETMNAFDARFTIRKDGTVQVAEQIIYDFGAAERHGIYRTIPLISPNGPRIMIEDVTVTDGSGATYPFTVSASGDTETIRIGDPQKTVTGRKTYTIGYRVENIIRGFTDHEEFYWNVTGNEWQVPIGHVEATVELPDASAADIRVQCFTGSAGNTETACTSDRTDGIVRFVTTRSFESGEGLSIVVGMPLGSVTAVAAVATSSPSSFVEGTSFSEEFGFPFFLLGMLPFLLFIFVIIVIVTKLQRMSSPRRYTKPVIPKELKHDPIIAFYEPPDHLPPIEVGTIYDREVDPTDISSVIIDLAVRGYLKIRRIPIKVLFFKSDDFEFTKLKDGADLSTPADKEIFAMLFSESDTVKVSELRKRRTTLWESVKRIRENTLDRIEEEGYFDKEAYERSRALLKRRGWFTFAFFVLYFPFIFFVASRLPVPPWLAVTIFVAVATLASHAGWLAIHFGRKLTPKGIQALREILGFEEFLKVTEKDRLKMMSSPSADSALFEKNLPYAMVFGVEKEWAKKFKGIYAAMPVWYEDPTMSTFNAALFASQLGVFSAAVSGSFGAYSGSGSYSSGFGGGGFSGGGSGGGGGGSW